MRKNPTVHLSEIANLINGSAFRPEDWSDSGLPIIRIQNLNDPKKPFNCWNGSLEKKVLVEPGDVLLAWSGTPGTSFGAHIWNGKQGVLNQHIFRVDLDHNRALKSWVVPAINTQLEVLIAHAHGGVGLRHVKKSEVEALEIPLPSLEKQKEGAERIEFLLSRVLEMKFASISQFNTCDALEVANFKERFFSTTPISIGLSPATAPDGWTWRPLSDLARLESGHTPSRKHPEWWGGDIPWIGLPDIRGLDGKVAQETKNYTNPEGIKNSSARLLPAETVVFGRDVQVGFTTIMGRPMATSQHFFNWICGEELLPRFLLHALRASKSYLEAQASGAIHQTIYMGAAKEFHLCLPDKRTQQKIVDQLDDALSARETLLAAAKAEREAIEALPAAILREVFSDAA